MEGAAGEMRTPPPTPTEPNILLYVCTFHFANYVRELLPNIASGVQLYEDMFHSVLSISWQSAMEFFLSSVSWGNPIIQLRTRIYISMTTYLTPGNSTAPSFFKIQWVVGGWWSTKQMFQLGGDPAGRPCAGNLQYYLPIVASLPKSQLILWLLLMFALFVDLTGQLFETGRKFAPRTWHR
jgi:hypothetical protein